MIQTDTHRPDEELVERLREQDVAALEHLMDRFGDRLYRVALGIVRNAADAEEVVQDVFLKLLRKIDSFEGRAALGTWLYRVTVNTALNKRRGRRAALTVPIEDCLPAFLPDGHREGDRSLLLLDWSPLPDDELLAGERRRMMSDALDRLPDHYRAVLLLRDVEGLSSEETAEALGESVASVKSRLHRARMVLREAVTKAVAAPMR
jgi:RNA polymerase sigma-70 factor (ECF subfamily)